MAPWMCQSERRYPLRRTISLRLQPVHLSHTYIHIHLAAVSPIPRDAAREISGHVFIPSAIAAGGRGGGESAARGG